MEFSIASISDVGIKRSNNQDSLSVMVAHVGFNQVAFAVICDGMGGFSKGELASATIIRAFNDWFQNDFSKIVSKRYNDKKFTLTLKDTWNQIIQQQNNKIKEFGAKNNIQLGSTISLLLCYNDKYYITHVGDTRIYMISNTITQITKDHTLLQYEIDNKKLTDEEIENYPKKNVLLQCVGVNNVIPSFYSDNITSNCSFLLCSDGFRHKISSKEIFDSLKYDNLVNEPTIKNILSNLTELNKQRLENDNISSILVKVKFER